MAIGYRKCPDCEQDVLKTATECRNCGFSFVGAGASEQAPEEEQRKFARVEIFTAGFRLVGVIILGGVGFDFRLSDFLNTKAQRFFPVLDAEILDLKGQSLRKEDVVMVSKEDVKMLIPLEEPDREDNRIKGLVSSVTHRY